MTDTIRRPVKALGPGALAVVQPPDPTRIGPGTVIVFVDPLDRARLVAHRVVRVLPGTPLRFETRGDANLAADPLPVPVASVRGVVAWAIPGLGSVVIAFRGAPAVILLVVMPLGILVVTELDAIRRRLAASSVGSP